MKNNHPGSETQMAIYVKNLLTCLGKRFSRRSVHNLNAAINYLEVGRWMQEQGYDTRHRFRRKEQLWDLVSAQVGDRQVLYLEFGVYQGATTRYVAKRLRHRDAMLHGFDSFHGLPEAWNIQAGTGFFSTNGALPQIDDSRVHFHKGWFDQTLPDFRLPSHEVLVLNLDADLYSSTIYVLNHLRDAIVPGTYIYFDEFCDRHHELKAFDEFRCQTGMKFRLLGVTRALQKALFQRVEA